MRRSRQLVLLATTIAATGVMALAAPLASAATRPAKMSCWYSTALCTEIANPSFWGHWYVGHDEPSLLFYSNQPGSGNDMTYQLQIPKEPPGAYSQSKSYNFELRPAFWFGMAMCDTQSYPETVRYCQPDSDRNIVPVTPRSTDHPGTAFTELQFYPPGWVKQFNAFSCDPRKWCAALNIDSLSENPITGQTLNTACQNQVLGGLEYINYAYLTRSGRPQGPPNPLQFDPVASGDPGPSVLYMNPGDKLTVSLRDSPQGLLTTVVDHTTGQTGSMTASAANGFGQIKFAPNGTQCKEIPYDFHPMYSTSSPQTRVIWAAHSYNIAFSDEIGHFDFCTSIDPATGSCDGLEGAPGDQEPADGDDNLCFPASMSLLYPVTGCTDANDPGFDGPSYLRDWPDGSSNHPTPVLFSSPVTGDGDRYSQAAFETDLPRIEASDYGGTCNRTTGAGCTNPPITDDGQPAAFYPYYSTTRSWEGGCRWGIGSTLPNTINDFGGSSTSEFGPLYRQQYFVDGGGGATDSVIDDYHQTLSRNPC